MPCVLLAHRLGAVALVTAGLVIVDIETSVGVHLNRRVMVTMQVCLVTVPSLSQLLEDDICRRLVDAVPPSVADDIRLPTAVNALPTISDETLDPESAVVGIVSAREG